MIDPAWLRQVPGCEHGQAPRRCLRLGSGTAHAIWRVITASGDFVLRAPDASLPIMLTTAFDREVQLQQAAAAVGIAPSILATDAARQLMVMQYVDGQHLTEQQLLQRPRLAQLLATLARLHAEAQRPALAPLDPLANATQFAQEIAARGGSAPMLQRLIARRLEQAARLWQICCEDGRAPVVVHCDLHVGNIIARDTHAPPLVLLDWEYAAVGDPLLDYAALVAQYPAAQAAVEAHLRQFAGSQHIANDRLAAASAVFVLLSWLWWKARALQQPDDAAANLQMAALERRLDASLEHALGLVSG